MEHLAFHAGQREYRNESQDDDDHREEYRTSDELRGVERDFPDLSRYSPCSSEYFSAWRMTFSVMTIPASTSTPIAIAIPPSDMMFDEIPHSA